MLRGHVTPVDESEPVSGVGADIPPYSFRPLSRKSKCDGKQPVCKACSDSGHEVRQPTEADPMRDVTNSLVYLDRRRGLSSPSDQAIC